MGDETFTVEMNMIKEDRKWLIEFSYLMKASKSFLLGQLNNIYINENYDIYS